MLLQHAQVHSPLGTLHLHVQDEQLIALVWDTHRNRTMAHLERHLGPFTVETKPDLPAFTKPIRSYFNGDLDALDAIEVAPPGTPFQRTVWSALRTIPRGHTWSYRQLAESISRPKAYRAVAQANGHNPIPLIIPCHRVIASDGGIGGFSCGLDRKRWLLGHETASPLAA